MAAEEPQAGDGEPMTTEREPNSPANDCRFIRSITPQNILSFGSAPERIELESLNVLIGPNGAGKSNLLEVIDLLRSSSSAKGFGPLFAGGGGFDEWVWKGNPNEPLGVEVEVSGPNGETLRHRLSLKASQQSFALDNEQVDAPTAAPGGNEPHVFYDYRRGRPVINTTHERRKLSPDSVAHDASILAQRRDPDSYPELFHLAAAYDGVRLYREWAFGRNTVFRVPQGADLRNDRLEEDFSNLGMVLNRLERHRPTKKAMVAELSNLYDGLVDFGVGVVGGTVQVQFTEGEYSFPATRLSDGSLRFLCLLAILCDPNPPALIGIEEPELGLHPDVLPVIADLLVAASTRTQVIVTTHSDVLVDSMTSRPSAIVVCEKRDAVTRMQRLNQPELGTWLQRYRLGELWSRGQLGGTRW